MKIKDGVALTRKWRGAVAEDETILGFFDWVRSAHPDAVLEDDPPTQPAWVGLVNGVQKQQEGLRLDIDTLAARLDDIEASEVDVRIRELVRSELHKATTGALNAIYKPYQEQA